MSLTTRCPTTVSPYGAAANMANRHEQLLPVRTPKHHQVDFESAFMILRETTNHASQGIPGWVQRPGGAHEARDTSAGSGAVNRGFSPANN